MGQADDTVWQHIKHNQLSLLIWNTVILLLLVSLFALLIGTSLAWWVTMHDFKGRRFFEWALMLPLAMPAYVMAFTQLGLFDYTGPVQSFLRAILGANVQAFFPLRSAAGVALVMSLAFYPYVYLLARIAFQSMGRRALEVGQSFGYSPRIAFWRVALPMARPWLVGGVMLVAMETLADFGAVSIFNYDTLTTGVYKAWFALFSLSTAMQLAGFLLLGVVTVVSIERIVRGQRSYIAVGSASKNQRTLLRGWAACGVISWCVIVLGLAFVLPVGQLLIWAWPTWRVDLNTDFMAFVRGSLGLSAIAALSVTTVALCMSVFKRRTRSPWVSALVMASTLGYAVPGTVLAVGVFVPVAWLDNWLIGSLGLNVASGAILKGSLWVMMWAYVVRFLAVGFSSVDGAMQRVTVSQERAARSLGLNAWSMMWRVYLPLTRGGVLTAMLMVFVDVMKEMPMTLMTRPFGWETLSVRIFSLTTEGLWREAALPSLALIVSGLCPVLYLAWQGHQKGNI